MFFNKGRKIAMVEGDFGVALPFEIELEGGESLTENDNFRISIFNKLNSEAIIEKNYTVDEENTFDFTLTEEESKKLKVGFYMYDIDYYSGKRFMNNLIAKEDFEVYEKARDVNED